MIPDRDKRVARAIYKLILKIFSMEIRDPILKNNILITKVELSKDLSIAKIYFHISNLKDKNNKTDFNNKLNKKDEKKYLNHLNKLSGFLRKRIAEEINLKYCPSIRFQQDKSYNKGENVIKLLNKIKDENS